MDVTTLRIATTVSQIKVIWDGFATLGGLLVSSWFKGSDAWAIREATTQTINVFVGLMDPVIRGQFLDTATDPGDEDPFNAANASQPLVPGRLSALGENTFGTVRDPETSATGSVVVANGSGSPFGPLVLDFKSTTPDPTTGAFPTYTSAAAVTLAAGASAAVTVVCDVPGSFGTRTDNSVTTLVTGLPGVTVTQPGPIIGTDREARDTYRTRCRQAANRLSFSDTQSGVAYLSTQNIDGTPLLNASGIAVAITRIYVSGSSSTGGLSVYYASNSGPAAAADVTAANANIQAAFVMLGDTVTLGPDSGGGTAATQTTVTVTGSVEVKNGTGGLSGTALQSAVAAALAAAVQAPTGPINTAPIGGLDQVSGAGFVYATDLVPSLAAAYPGIYKIAASVNGNTAAAVALGHVPVPNSTAGSWSVTTVN